MKFPMCSLSEIINTGAYIVMTSDKEFVAEVNHIDESTTEEFKNAQPHEFQLNPKIVEPLSFVVKLYGLIPVGLVVADGTGKLKACKDWTLESEQFVGNCLKEAEAIAVHSILIQQRTVYGDLFIKSKSESKFFSLRKLLCKNKFCVFSENTFLRKESLNPQSGGLERRTKMEQIRELQTNTSFFGNITQQNYNMRNFEHLNKKNASAEYSPNSGSLEGAKCNASDSVVLASDTCSKGSQVRDVSDGDFSNTCRGSDTVSRGVLPEAAPKHPHGSGRLQRDVWDFVDISGRFQNETQGLEGSTTGQEGSGRKLLGAGKKTTSNLPKVGRILRKERFGLGNISKSESLKGAQVQAEAKAEESSAKRDDGMHTVLKGSEEARKKKENGSLVRKSNKPEWEEQSKLIPPTSYSVAPFIVFENTGLECVNCFQDLPIQARIIKNLEKMGDKTDVSSLQRWAIPAIRMQHNTIVIGSPRSGKMLSYLVPLIDYIENEAYLEEVEEGNGPLVVVLTASSDKCHSVYSKCVRLIGEQKLKQFSVRKVRLMMVYGGGREHEMKVNLTNGCDMLITTPPCLLRLMECPIVTNLDRLVCLVLEDIDVISENPFRKDVRMILEKTKLSTKGRHYQKILVGEKWTGQVESIVKTYVHSYAAVIGSYLEAIIYEKLMPTIFLIEKEKKAELLLKEVKRSLGRRIVIFCQEIDEALWLGNFLHERGIELLVVHEKVLAQKLWEAETAWKDSSLSVLVMSDEVISEIDVREAQVLIHFDLPFKAITNFSLRYTTVLNYYENHRAFRKTSGQGQNIRVVVLLDEDNYYQLPHIVELVERLGGKMPEEVVTRSVEVRRVMEASKRSFPICENLLALGRCRNWRHCSQRHTILKDLDMPKNLPRSGWVNFVVVNSLNASLMSVRLLEHVGVDGKVRKFENRRKEVMEEMEKCFGQEGKRRALGVVKVGSVCGVKNVEKQGKGNEEKEVFYRGEVIEVVGVDKCEMPSVVKVKLLDEGSVWIRNVKELFELEKKLAKEPPTVVDVRIVEVQAMDYDIRWSEQVNLFAWQLMMQKLKKDQFWSGKVVLSLRNTLFLDEIKRKQFLSKLKLDVFDLVVRDELVKSNFAITNPDHLPPLYKLSKEAGIDIPKKEELKKGDSAKVEPQWAFFDATVEKVKFLSAETTELVFLQLKKFDRLLEYLEDDCQTEGEATAEKIKAGNKELKPRVSVGSYCLAPFEDGRWNRGRVDMEKEREFYIFFIDHGDFLYVPKEDVVPISPALLLRLPCQAIECRLVGIDDSKKYLKEIMEEMYIFSEEGLGDMYAHVTSNNLKPAVTQGRKYNVILMNKAGFSLNKRLVEEGLVTVNEMERCHLDLVKKKIEEKWGTEGEESVEAEAEEEEEEKEEAVAEEGVEQRLNEDKEKGELCSYFNNLTDDMFEDENALEFLKGFASKILNVPDALEEVNRRRDALPTVQKTKAPEKIRQRMPAPEKKGGSKKDLNLRSRDVRTPQVLWSQGRDEIRLKILLGNVSDHYMECSQKNFSFRCLLEEKFYAVDLRLFGAVNPQMMTVTAKAFEVSVVMKKLASPFWWRLVSDEGKLRWITLNVDGLKDKECKFQERIVEAKREIVSGRLKEGFKGEKIEAYSDSEGSSKRNISSDSESSDSDI